MNAPRMLLIAAAVLIIATGATAVYTIYNLGQGRSAGGAVISDASITIGGPFTLTDHTGKRVTQADFTGKPWLVFFGFTHCPDICPTKLSEITTVLNELGTQADDLEVLFVSVDPERDTPEVLAEYIDYFHPNITGLTGTLEEVADVAKAFRAYYKKVPLDDGDYTVDHSAVVYLFDRQAQFVSPVVMERPVADVVRQLRAVL